MRSTLKCGKEGALSGFGNREQPTVHDYGAPGVEIIADLIGDGRMPDADARGPRP